MSKAWISTVVSGACYSLAVLIGFQVFNALDTQKGLDSQQALYQAEQSLSTICRQHGFSAKGLHLIKETAPEQGQTTWHFVFAHPTQNLGVSIQVDEQGQAFEETTHSS